MITKLGGVGGVVILGKIKINLNGFFTLIIISYCTGPI